MMNQQALQGQGLFPGDVLEACLPAAGTGLSVAIPQKRNFFTEAKLSAIWQKRRYLRNFLCNPWPDFAKIRNFAA